MNSEQLIDKALQESGSFEAYDAISLVFIPLGFMGLLLNVTCLYIAIKVHEPVELSLSLLIELCRGAYNQEQILKTENIVLSAIGWAVNPPSSHEFIRYFIDILPDKIQEKQRKELTH